MTFWTTAGKHRKRSSKQVALFIVAELLPGLGAQRQSTGDRKW